MEMVSIPESRSVCTEVTVTALISEVSPVGAFTVTFAVLPTTSICTLLSFASGSTTMISCCLFPSVITGSSTAAM